MIKRVSNGVLLLQLSSEAQRQFWSGWYASIPEVDVPLERHEPPVQERDWTV